MIKKHKGTLVLVGCVCVVAGFLLTTNLPPKSSVETPLASVRNPQLPSVPFSASDAEEAKGMQGDSDTVKNNVSQNQSRDLDVFELPDSNPAYPTFYDRYLNIVARRAGLEFDPNALYQAMQQPSAWDEAEQPPSNHDLNDAEKNDGRTFITFSTLKLESLAPGDTLQVSIGNDDINFEAKITNVETEGMGESVTWYGESNTPGSTDSITLTQADGLTLGGIFTDNGLYQLEVRDGQGYIVSNATLFRHGGEQVVYVPPEYAENPPDEYVEFETETFGGSNHSH